MAAEIDWSAVDDLSSGIEIEVTGDVVTDVTKTITDDNQEAGQQSVVTNS